MRIQIQAPATLGELFYKKEERKYLPCSGLFFVLQRKDGGTSLALESQSRIVVVVVGPHPDLCEDTDLYRDIQSKLSPPPTSTQPQPMLFNPENGLAYSLLYGTGNDFLKAGPFPVLTRKKRLARLRTGGQPPFIWAPGSVAEGRQRRKLCLAKRMS